MLFVFYKFGLFFVKGVMNFIIFEEVLFKVRGWWLGSILVNFLKKCILCGIYYIRCDMWLYYFLMMLLVVLLLFINMICLFVCLGINDLRLELWWIFLIKFWSIECFRLWFGFCMFFVYMIKNLFVNCWLFL